MARTAAELPAGIRLTDHISLGVLTAQFPMDLVEQVLFEAFGDANPMRTGASSDLLSMIPFVIMMVILYLVGREKLLAPKRS